MRTLKIIIACFAIAVFSCCLNGIAGFDDEKQAKSNEETEKYKFKVETDLVEVRAIVTDQKGRIVEGLKKEDFELRENKEPLEISHFNISKVESGQDRIVSGKGETPDKETKLQQADIRLSNPPVRTILLYVDALHLSFASLNRVKQTLHRFIDEQLTDQDLVAFTSSETLGVAQQFTRDRKILRHAVEQIRLGPVRRENFFTPNLAAQVLKGQREALSTAIDIIRHEENSICPCARFRTLAHNMASQVLAEASYSRKNTLSIIEHFAEQMTDLPGKRMIIVFSDGFTSYNIVGAIQNEELQKSISRAVRSGVAIYSIDAKGLQAPPIFDTSGWNTFDGIYNSLLECIDGCTGNAEAVSNCKNDCIQRYPPPTNCKNDALNYDPRESPDWIVCKYPSPGMLASYVDASEIEKLNGLHSLAEQTGGKMYNNTNDLNGALGQALDDNRFFYVLSYYLKPVKDDSRFRRIEVRVRNHPEYNIRSPRGYWPSKTSVKPEEDAAKTPQQRLIQAMGSPLPITDLGVSARADFIETESDDKQVSLTVYFEGDRFQYREQDQQNTFGLEILYAIYDSSGKQVEGISAQIEGKLTQERLAQAKTSGYQFSRRITLKPGAYQARIGVREEGTNRIGTATTWLEVPEPAPNKLQMSDLILRNPLDTNLVDKEGIDIRQLEQIRIVQGLPMYAKDDVFYYSFRVHRGNQVSPGSGLLLMSELLQEGKPVRTEKWSPISTEQKDMDSKGWFDLDGELDISKLDPGTYELRINIKDSQSDKTIQRTVAFGIL